MSLKKYLTGQFINVPGCLSFAHLQFQGHDLEPADKGKKVRRKIIRSMPHFFIRDIRDINPEVVKELGIKAIISDKDNTLTKTYSKKIIPELEYALVELKSAVNQNFYVVSNSAGTFFYEEEAKAFELHNGIRVIRHFFKKPWGYKAALKQIRVQSDEVMVIGDRIYTDIVFGNNMGALTVLVQKYTDEGEVTGISGLREKELTELEEMCKEKGYRAPHHPKAKTELVTHNKLSDLYSEW
ncbi:MAG: YqeG family HAD IIIA-type phosphatase [Nanoarchaeota archaeon]|nr:YqeG family HAD IIIA-type phosphatase [Nanoarchaeota archaeon]